MFVDSITSLERKKLKRVHGYRKAKKFAQRFGCYQFRAPGGYCGHLAVSVLLRVPLIDIVRLKKDKWTGHTDMIQFGNALSQKITTEQMDFTGRRVEAWTVGANSEHYIYIEGHGRHAQVMDNFFTGPFAIWSLIWGSRKCPPLRMPELPLVLDDERTTMVEYDPASDPFA